MSRRGVLFACFVSLLAVGACKDKEVVSSDEVFDRSTLLVQVSDALLLPAFDSLATSAEELRNSVEHFSKTAKAEDLLIAQVAWFKAFRHFQATRMFNFGPSETSLLGDHNENLGTWPIDTAEVESRIESADTKMQDFRRDTRGFGALEYLLFEPQVLVHFQGPLAALRFSYLNELAKDIRQWSARLKNDWLVYSPSFKHDVGKSAGSSTSELYNHWIQSYELLKNYKVALPAGLQVGQTAAAPNLVESPFAHASMQSIKWQLMKLEAIWYGIGIDGKEGIGFDDYLQKATGGEALRNEIIAQWAAIHKVLYPIDDTVKLSELVVNDPAKAEAIFTELQKMTRFIKGDMSSILGIAITYSSGDGD